MRHQDSNFVDSFNSSTLRSPSTVRAGTREVHNKLEKNRRAHLKECFEALKKQLPITPDEKKTSNLSILGAAIRHIQVNINCNALFNQTYAVAIAVSEAERAGVRAWNGTFGEGENRCSEPHPLPETRAHPVGHWFLETAARTDRRHCREGGSQWCVIILPLWKYFLLLHFLLSRAPQRYVS